MESFFIRFAVLGRDLPKLLDNIRYPWRNRRNAFIYSEVMLSAGGGVKELCSGVLTL